MNIFITRAIPEIAKELLEKEGHTVEVSPHDRVLTREELLEGVKGKDAVMSLLTDTIDDEVYEAAGDTLKIVANYAVGYDNIDVPSATKRKITITNTPGVLTHAVAEFTIALLFAISRRVVEADTYTRTGKYKGWEPMLFLGTELAGKTLGIVGVGRIGSEVAKRARMGLGMNILYNDIKSNEAFEKEFDAQYKEDLKNLLEEADAVSLHVPLLPATRHLIGKEQLDAMKDTAVLINTSRGPIVDEKALVEALKANAIQGAALDVFEEEPTLAPGLADLSNVVLTPHIASATLETRTKMAEMAAKNTIAVLKGEEPQNPVRE